MLIPETKQILDYSKYKGKEFIVKNDIDMVKTNLGIPILKGVRFIIKNIKKTQITIKISNSKSELEQLGMLQYDFNRIKNNIQRELNTLKEVYKMWDDEPEMFIVDKNSRWNCGDEVGRCINTGFNGIPDNHPDKYGMAKPRYDENGNYYNNDTIMTLDYKRIDNKLNIYSYQRGTNIFYSKETYGFVIKAKENYLINWKKQTVKNKNWVSSQILQKKEISINTLNKIDFEQI